MLNQIALTDAILARATQQGAHGAQLMEARKDRLALLAFFAVGVGFVLRHHLREALDDVGQRFSGEYLLPQVIGFQTMRIGRVARAAVPTLVERQEPRGLALQLGAERHFGIVHRDMGDAASGLEQQFLGVAGGAVLDDGVGNGLLGQRVFQLEGQHWQAVDEDCHVQRVAGVVAVAQLPGDAEDVVGEGCCGAGVARRRQQFVEVGV